MKKKKIILVIAIVFGTMLSMPSFSQIRFGIKAGVDLDNATLNSSAFKVENLTSFQVGPSMELMLPVSNVDFGIDLSLLYSDNRMTVDNVTGSESKKDVSNRYLMLPLNAKIKFDLGSDMFKLYGLAGPYAGYLISGDKIDFTQIGDDIKAKSFQGGLNFGVGVELFNFVQVGANYKVKLTDNYSTEKPEWNDPLNGKSQTWSLTAAIYF